MKSFLFFLFFGLFLHIQSPAQSWKINIETSIEALNKAIISKDKPVLEKLTADSLSYGHSTGLIEDKSEFINDILSGPVKFISIDIENQTINLADDIAIIRHIASIKGIKSGAPMDLKIGILMIWRKQGDNWLLLARQGYKL